MDLRTCDGRAATKLDLHDPRVFELVEEPSGWVAHPVRERRLGTRDGSVSVEKLRSDFYRGPSVGGRVHVTGPTLCGACGMLLP